MLLADWHAYAHYDSLTLQRYRIDSQLPVAQIRYDRYVDDLYTSLIFYSLLQNGGYYQEYQKATSLLSAMLKTDKLLCHWGYQLSSIDYSLPIDYAAKAILGYNYKNLRLI